MKTHVAYASAALVGVIFGIAANSPALLGQWTNLIIWAVVGLLVGLFIEDKKYVNSSGILYGFFVTMAFLISGFQGASGKLLGFLMLSLALSLVGALCGWCLVATANSMKRHFRQ